jgi:uncharacterized OsmC-like protein
MTITEQPMLNGVNTDGVFATIEAVAGKPELGAFTFRANSRWLSGTHSQSTSAGFHGAGQEHDHQHMTTVDIDHPAVLVGTDEGPTPVEYLLYGLAGCLTAGIANVASARGVKLNSVEATVEGDIDLRAIFGITDEVRNGYQAMRVSFRIDAEAPDEKVRQIVAQSQARSAVFDVLTNGTAVAVDVTTV